MTRFIRELLNLLLIALGILSAGMGLHGFLLSSNFIDGGMTGVSMLLSKTTGDETRGAGESCTASSHGSK
jgi:uncharacterized membrane-anchored protein YitT (DUF2179 family)